MGRSKKDTKAVAEELPQTEEAPQVEEVLLQSEEVGQEETASASEPAAELEVLEEVEDVMLEDCPPEVRLAVTTLSGDIRDAILERLRHEQDTRPWNERSETEQRNTINRIDSMAQNLVREACMLIAGEGQTTISAKIESVTVKDEIKATVTVPRHDNNRFALVDAQGARVLMVVVQPELHIAERAPVRVTPDQPDLIEQTEQTEVTGKSDHPVEDESSVEPVLETEPASDLVIGGMPQGPVNGSGHPIEQTAI